MNSSGEKSESILLVSQYFPPDITAAAFRIGDLAKYLHENTDLNVHVLTSEPYRVVLTESDEMPIPESQVTRVHVNSKSALFQYLEFLIRAKLAIWRLRKRWAWVFVTSPPWSVFIVAHKFFSQEKLFLDIRDLWPDSAVAAGKLKGRGFVYRMLKGFERWMYARADQISAVATPMAEYIENNSPSRQVSVVYNGVPADDVKLARSLPVRETSEANGVLDVFYAGNIGRLQGLEIIPRALALTEDLPVRFHIVGSGVMMEQLELEAERQRVGDRLVFHPAMPRSKLLPFVATNADALFLHLQPDWVLEKTIPSKVFDYLLWQKPILCGISGEGRAILSEVPSTLFFEQAVPQSLADCARQLHKQAPVLAAQARGKSLEVVERYTRERQFAVMAKLLV